MVNVVSRSKASSHPSPMGGIYVGIVKTVAADGRVFVSIPKLGNTIGPLRVVNSDINFPLVIGEQVLCAYTSMSNDEMYVIGYINPRNLINAGFTYKVGDTGPGGGIIFFVDRFNEYAGFTYLEVAPVGTQLQRTWATNTTTAVNGADSRALGGGYQNTLDIVAQTGNVAATCAAAYCADLVSGGQSDWYLPSISELQLVRNVVYNQLGVGGFLNSSYWSSTENIGSNAWYHTFHTELLDTLSKNQNQYVRPVRRF